MVSFTLGEGFSIECEVSGPRHFPGQIVLVIGAGAIGGTERAECIPKTPETRFRIYDEGQAVMPNLDVTSILLWSGATAGIAVIYYSFLLAREWFRQQHAAGKGVFRKIAMEPETSLNAHIASQWTDGRLRLDSILTLIKSLANLLEKEVKTLRGLDRSDPQYEGEVRQMVAPTLRCFTFDKHLRDECLVLIPLLRFCAQDLAQSQGLDMTQQLTALDEIQAAIETANLH